MKNNTLTIKECSDRIHKSESAIRVGLQRGGWDYHIPEEAVEHYMKYGNFPVIIVNGEDVTKLVHSLANNIAADMIKKGEIEDEN